MGLTEGDRITYRLLPDMTDHDGTVLSFDEDAIVLRADAAPAATAGSYIIIAETGRDIDYYAEIIGVEGTEVRLRRKWAGKRSYFRVNDSFPLVLRKREGGAQVGRSRLFSGCGMEPQDLDLPDDTINPRLWQMLVDISAKLSVVMERLNLQDAGLAGVETVPVNISASGIRVETDQPFALGDSVEIRMVLPLYPPVGVITFGIVVRADEATGGRRKVAVQFTDLEDDVEDVIIQYALKRQRELIRQEKHLGDDA